MSSSSASTQERRVDHSALRTNQAFIIGLNIVAFVLGLWPIVTFVAVVMLLGTLIPRLSLFKSIYASVLKPTGLVRPDVKIDNPEPHLFAQGVGGIVLTLATLAFIGNLSVVGWVLSWFVVALASLNLFAGICVGCLMYYQFSRLGVPGFTRKPIRQ